MTFGDITVLAVLACVVFLIIRKMLLDKRKGKHCCGDCNLCSGCSSSHSK